MPGVSSTALHNWKRRIICITVPLILLAVMLKAETAGADFNPGFEVSLLHSSNPNASVRSDEVPLFATTVSHDSEDDFLETVRVVFPHGWKVNNVSPLRPAVDDLSSIGMCQFNGAPDRPGNGDFERPGENDNTQNRCAENTIIGEAEVEVFDTWGISNEILNGTGNVHLLTSDWNDDPVRIGIYLAVPVPVLGQDPLIIQIPIYGYIKVEGDVGSEQIVAVFDGIPHLRIQSFILRLTNDGQRGLIRTPVECGEREFSAMVTSFIDVDIPGSSTPLIDEDCDLANPQEPRTFEPTMPTAVTRTKAAGQHPNLFVGIGGDMNNGAAGYESLKSLRFSLPKGMVGSLFPFANGDRCGVDVEADAWRNNEDPCEEFKIGNVSARVDAAQQFHMVQGFVYLSDPIDDGDLAAMRFVFPNPPIRLDTDGDPDTRDPLVLTAGIRLNPDTNRVEAIMRELPTTYEIKVVLFVLNGEPERAVRPFLTNPTSCTERSFDAVLTSDRNTNHEVKSNFQATACNLAFTPDFTLDLSNPEPGRTTDTEIKVEQPEGQAHAKAAHLLFAQGFRTNGELDGVTPCRAVDVSNCDARSAIGTATANSPALAGAPFDAELQGDLHLMHTEPGKRLKVATALTNDRLSLTIKQQGVIKMQRNGQGKFQIESDLDLPELPITDFTVTLAKKLLRNPWRCGGATLESRADFTSYSGLSHASGSSKLLRDCGAPLPYSPGLAFSPQTNAAGTPTNLSINFNRAASTQTTRDVELTLPKGWSADVLTKPICPNDQASRSACPNGSRIGGVKANVRIFRFLPRLVVDGTLHRCEPNGSDTAAACVDLLLPEIAGGGHLRLKGRILVRDNAQKIVIIVKDIPTEFDVELEMTIKGNTTPTFCSANPASAKFTGEAGTVVSGEAPYSSTGCENLKYRPRVDFTLSTTRANAEPAITTKISQPAGDATTEKMKITLPKGLRPNLAMLAKSCSAAQWATRSCSAETKLGDMEVETPLLNETLKGPVYFGDGAKIYMQLGGLVPLNLEGRVNLSGSLGFEVTGLPAQPLRVATVNLKAGLFKNPSDCDSGGYGGEFTSHAGHTASSAGEIDFCDRKNLKLSAKLKPNRAKAYPKALFKITQKRSHKSIRSFKIKLGAGSKAKRMRFRTSRLARKGRARRKGSLIGKISITPAKRSPSVRARIYGKNKRVKVKSDKRNLRRLSKKIKTLRKKVKRAKKKTAKSKRKNKKSISALNIKLRQAKRDLVSVRKLQKYLQKKTRFSLKGNTLSIRGLPKVASKRISLRLYGKKYRLLRNPSRAGTVKLTGTFKLSGNTNAKAETKLKIRERKSKKRSKSKKKTRKRK